MTYEFSWFNKNNSLTIEDVKNMSTKIDYRNALIKRPVAYLILSVFMRVLVQGGANQIMTQRK